MNKYYKIKDILSAIDNLLEDNENKALKLTDEVKEKKPIINKVKEDKNKVPNETENIILQAEKYLKK
tara:strand:+ start:515 stop:715 length:201 start_codon:yes stop_codon:yes gene_type:complete